MKKDIHPKYNDKAKVICACGNSFIVGSTLSEIKTELCSACHPFYTGKQKLVDTARRVEKFQAKIDGVKKMSGASKGKTAKRAAKAATKAAKTVKITKTTVTAAAKKTASKKKKEKKTTKKTDKK
ncbi:MAG: 50S ribosomal protein L31 [Patescibacteria group bacterium]|nr:50S ribosomal protein L31 [Patescibacteria group bacterium]